MENPPSDLNSRSVCIPSREEGVAFLFSISQNSVLMYQPYRRPQNSSTCKFAILGLPVLLPFLQFRMHCTSFCIMCTACVISLRPFPLGQMKVRRKLYDVVAHAQSIEGRRKFSGNAKLRRSLQGWLLSWKHGFLGHFSRPRTIFTHSSITPSFICHQIMSLDRILHKS